MLNLTTLLTFRSPHSAEFLRYYVLHLTPRFISTPKRKNEHIHYILFLFRRVIEPTNCCVHMRVRRHHDWPLCKYKFYISNEGAYMCA